MTETEERVGGTVFRTGETVYVDYLNQFQTDTASLAAVKQPTRPNEKQRHEMPAAIKGRLSEGDFRVGWTTNADGKTVGFRIR